MRRAGAAPGRRGGRSLGLLSVLAASGGPLAAAAADAAKRPPPMGWNPCMDTPGFGPYAGTCGGRHPPDEDLLLTTALALRSTGLASRGYRLLELDDGWHADARDAATGEIRADPKLFPSGMANVSVRLAAMDPPMYLGLYTDRGTTTCAGKPGSAGHEVQDAATYIKWGVRQVKADSCAAPSEHHAAIDQYRLMQDGLELAPADRPIFFSLCGWFNWYGAAGPRAKVGNSYRLATDVIGYEQLLLNIDAVAPVAEFLEPGRWPDLDMIGASSAKEGPHRAPQPVVNKRVLTHFSMVAVMGATLLLSFDVRNARNAPLVQIVSNPEVLAVHQDLPSSAGYMRRLSGTALAASMQSLVTGVDCAAAGKAAQWTFHANGSHHLGQAQGRLESAARPGWCLQASSGNGPNACGAATAALMPCGEWVLGHFCGEIDQWVMENGTVRDSGAAVHSVAGGALGDHLLTRDENLIDGALWLLPRDAASARPAALQRWWWDAARGQLRNGLDGTCVGVAAAPAKKVNVWGRRLSDGSWALVFVNAEPAGSPSLRVTCGWEDCLFSAGFAKDARLRVRDIHGRAPLADVVAGEGVAAQVESGGGSAMLRLTPAPPAEPSLLV